RAARAVPMALAVGLALVVSVALAVVAVAVGGAVAVSVAVTVPTDVVRVAGCVVFAVAQAVTLDGRVRGVAGTVLVSLLAALLGLPSQSGRDHLRGNCALRPGRALRRTRTDGVAVVTEVRRQGMLGDRDGHERVRLRVRVVTDRHLRRRILGGCRRGVHERDEA